jgi:hypothetical protein
MPFIKNKFLNLTRRQHQFFCPKQATIGEWQEPREDKKLVAKPTQSNRNLFLINGINKKKKISIPEIGNIDALNQQFIHNMDAKYCAIWKIMNSIQSQASRLTEWTVQNGIYMTGGKPFYEDPNYTTSTVADLDNLHLPTTLLHEIRLTPPDPYRKLKLTFLVLFFPIGVLVALYWTIHRLIGSVLLPTAGRFCPPERQKNELTLSRQSMKNMVNVTPPKFHPSWFKVWLKQVTLKIDSSIMLDCWIFGKQEASLKLNQKRRWLLIARGNAGSNEKLLNQVLQSNHPSYVRTLVDKLSCNVLIFNYPGEGRSILESRIGPSQQDLTKAYLGCLHYLQEILGAQEILLYNHSFGGVCAAPALANLAQKKDGHTPRYCVISNLTSNSLDSLIRYQPHHRAYQPLLCGAIARIVRLFGWTLDLASASQNLQERGILQIILQRGDEKSRDEMTITGDNVIQPRAALATTLHKRDNATTNRTHFIIRNFDHSFTQKPPFDSVVPMDIRNIVNESFSVSIQ